MNINNSSAHYLRVCVCEISISKSIFGFHEFQYLKMYAVCIKLLLLFFSKISKTQIVHHFTDIVYFLGCFIFVHKMPFNLWWIHGGNIKLESEKDLRLEHSINWINSCVYIGRKYSKFRILSWTKFKNVPIESQLCESIRYYGAMI